MEAKHTPGPWWVERVNKSTALFVDNADRSICQLTGKVDSERDANACLIAAAPDLLAACEQAAAFLLQIGYCGGGTATGAVLERAIAKVKGGA